MSTVPHAAVSVAAARGTDRVALMGGMAARIAPMGVMQPQDVGKAVAWLCSPAGKWVTGVSLPVDGGVHLRT